MANKPTTPIRGEVARFTKLNACGAPVTGVGSVIVTEGFIQVGLGFEYRDGVEYEAKKANGRYCTDEQGPPKLRWVTPTIDFCEVNPALLAMIGGWDLLTTGSDTTGFQMGDDLITNRWALELWQSNSGDAACAGGTVAYQYLVLPHIANAKVAGDYVVQDGTATFQVSGQTRKASTLWGQGPHAGAKHVPSAITKMFAMNYSTVTPPTASVDPIAL